MFPMSPKSLQKSSEWTSNEAIGPLTRVDVGKAIQLLSRSWCVHKKKGLRMAEIRIWSLTKKKMIYIPPQFFLPLKRNGGDILLNHWSFGVPEFFPPIGVKWTNHRLVDSNTQKYDLQWGWLSSHILGRRTAVWNHQLELDLQSFTVYKWGTYVSISPRISDIVSNPASHVCNTAS